MKFLVMGALALFTAFGCTDNTGGEAAEQETSIAEPNASAGSMPSFNLTNEKGEVVNLANLKGKKVFVNLWASWCPPCKREMPSIEKLYKSVNSNNVAFVILSLDDDFADAKEFTQSNGLQLPIYAPAQNLPALFNVQAIPSTFIFNETGELIKKVEGADDYDTEAYRQLLQ